MSIEAEKRMSTDGSVRK